MSNDRDLPGIRPISAEQVKDYLRKHPDFFEAHPELVENLQLPHESGKAISLIERQVTMLRERNIELRQRLNTLMDSARTNERLFEKTKRLALLLLEAEDLSSMVVALYESLCNDYQVEYHSLLLFGDEGTLPPSRARVVTIKEANANIGTLLHSGRSICGVLRREEMAFLFDDQAAQIGSVAAVTLQRGQTFGVLAIGNSDPNYYRSSMGTLFLSYIAEVLDQLMPQHLD